MPSAMSGSTPRKKFSVLADIQKAYPNKLYWQNEDGYWRPVETWTNIPYYALEVAGEESELNKWREWKKDLDSKESRAVVPTHPEQKDLEALHLKSDSIRRSAFSGMSDALRMTAMELRSSGYPTVQAAALGHFLHSKKMIDDLTKAYLVKYPDK